MCQAFVKEAVHVLHWMTPLQSMETMLGPFVAGSEVHVQLLVCLEVKL